MSATIETRLSTPGRRHLKVWHLVVVIAIYLVLVQVTSARLTAGQDFAYAAPTSIEYLVRAVVAPVGLGIVFTLAVVGYLGAWQEVFVDRRRLARWVTAIVVVLLATTVAITNYAGLAEKGLAFTLLLLVATLMVGFGEELLFRGIGVTVLRANGLSEFTVGLWTTVLFGVAHGTNIFSAGPSALVQVVLTTATGFVFYLVLRSTGALLMAMLAHGLWDFSVLSTQVDPENATAGANVAAVVLALILIAVLVMRKRLGRPATGTLAPSTATGTSTTQASPAVSD